MALKWGAWSLLPFQSAEPVVIAAWVIGEEEEEEGGHIHVHLEWVTSFPSQTVHPPQSQAHLAQILLLPPSPASPWCCNPKFALESLSALQPPLYPWLGCWQLLSSLGSWTVKDVTRHKCAVHPHPHFGAQ